MAVTLKEYQALKTAVKANPTIVQKYEKYIDEQLEKRASFDLPPVLHIDTRDNQPDGLPPLNYKDIEMLASLYRNAGWTVLISNNGGLQLKR